MPETSRKKILFVSTLESLPWGGSEELWSRAAGVLAARGHKVIASTRAWPQVPTQLLELQNAGVLLAPLRARVRDALVGKVWKGARMENKIAHILQNENPDLVVISLESQSAGLSWIQACRELNLPYALIVQACIEFLWPGDTVNLPLGEGYEKARKNFCVSNGNLKWLQTQFARELPQAEIVRQPFNVSYDAAPQWPDSGASTLRLACVGRLDPVAKGHDVLFNVLKSEKWRARKMEVSLFGGGGHEQSLRALAEYYQLSNVEFAAFTPDVEGIWRTHHALVLPSRFEGLPLVVVEAMLCARACIVTDVAGNAELLEDNVSGFVARVPHGDFLDEALERCWQSWERGELESIGQNAARRVRELVPRDPPAVLADKIENLLIENLLDKKS